MVLIVLFLPLIFEWIGALATVFGRAASGQVSCVYPCWLPVHSTTCKRSFCHVVAI